MHLAPSKAKKDLGWVPEITLDEMVRKMVAHDLSKAKQHALLKAHGFEVAVGGGAVSHVSAMIVLNISMIVLNWWYVTRHCHFY